MPKHIIYLLQYRNIRIGFRDRKQDRFSLIFLRFGLTVLIIVSHRAGYFCLLFYRCGAVIGRLDLTALHLWVRMWRCRPSSRTTSSRWRESWHVGGRRTPRCSIPASRVSAPSLTRVLTWGRVCRPGRNTASPLGVQPKYR
jgi:hypothetical protein